MANWNDVKRHMETGEAISPIPEGAELYPVVGVSFVPGYPKNIHELMKFSQSTPENISVNLVRNPQNAYDKNAIEVRFEDRMLGHLAKEVAARLAPRMDAGKTFLAFVYQIRVSPENPNNPGLDILLQEL